MDCSVYGVRQNDSRGQLRANWTVNPVGNAMLHERVVSEGETAEGIEPWLTSGQTYRYRCLQVHVLVQELLCKACRFEAGQPMVAAALETLRGLVATRNRQMPAAKYMYVCLCVCACARYLRRYVRRMRDIFFLILDSLYLQLGGSRPCMRLLYMCVYVHCHATRAAECRDNEGRDGGSQYFVLLSVCLGGGIFPFSFFLFFLVMAMVRCFWSSSGG